MGPQRKDTEGVGVSLRNKLVERASPYLEPGEQIQAVFRAQSGLSPYWLLLPYFVFVFFANLAIYAATVLTVTVACGAVVALSIVLIVFVRAHHVVVTDRAIVVLDVNRWTKRPTRLRLRHSRNFYFGQLSGLWGKFVLDNTIYWVPKTKQFQKDVAAADAALTQMTHPGPTGAAE
jgi:hypothetical protein